MLAANSSEQASLSVPRDDVPDDNTEEMALYGTAYAKVKMLCYDIDRTVRALEDRNDELMGRLDLDCLADLKREIDVPGCLARPDDAPPRLGRRGLQTLAILRTVARRTHAVEMLQDRRDRVIEVGRMIGAAEYSVQVGARGVDAAVWQAAALRFDPEHPVASLPVTQIYDDSDLPEAVR